MNPAEVIYNKIKERLVYSKEIQSEDENLTIAQSDMVCDDQDLRSVSAIDNIRVRTKLITRYYIDGMCQMIIDISTSHIENEYGCSVELFSKWYFGVKKQFSISLVEEVLVDFKDCLKVMKFDKVNSRLKTNTIDEGFGDDYKSKNKCCVCLDSTNQETNCRHFLCLQCFDNLKKQHCPTCRNRNLFVYYDEDSEEED